MREIYIFTSVFFRKISINRNIFCNFAGEMERCIQLGGRLLDLSHPRVMAIVNLSADSFYTSCNATDEKGLLSYVEVALQSGADILDIGACSTRPNSTPVDMKEELHHLLQGLDIIRHHWPHVPISVDTFRSEVAEQAILHGADMINDVYGGMDKAIWDVVAKNKVPYVLTHADDIQHEQCDMVMSQVLGVLQEKIDYLHRRGIADVVVDPGFGFGKTIEQNHTILRHLEVLEALHAPILVGVSRKSMLYKPLGLTPEEVLPATVATHTIALQRGANILRVHDVDAAVQAIKIHELMN